jgi:hypothetical protein
VTLLRRLRGWLFGGWTCDRCGAWLAGRVPAELLRYAHICPVTAPRITAGMRVFAKDDYECLTVVKVLTPEEKRSFGQDVDLVLRDARGYEIWLSFDDVTIA